MDMRYSISKSQPRSDEVERLFGSTILELKGVGGKPGGYVLVEFLGKPVLPSLTSKENHRKYRRYPVNEELQHSLQGAYLFIGSQVFQAIKAYQHGLPKP